MATFHHVRRILYVRGSFLYTSSNETRTEDEKRAFSNAFEDTMQSLHVCGEVDNAVHMKEGDVRILLHHFNYVGASVMQYGSRTQWDDLLHRHTSM